MLSVFSPATLRQYDTTTVPCPNYHVYVFSSNTATLRHYLILRMYVYYKVCVLQRHCDSTTLRQSLVLSMHICLCFLQRHCDSTTLRQSLVLSTGMHIMSVFSPATLRHYDTTLSFYCKISVFSCDTATVRHYASPLSWVCI